MDPSDIEGFVAAEDHSVDSVAEAESLASLLDRSEFEVF